jgi:diadenosine tetraphosphatase ApaH/serine/threonine PP2A family protein phosphatase
LSSRPLGVIADVHANLAALEVALDALSGAGALVCAGDLVGYGPQPNECVAALRKAGAACVAGNHDLVALGRDPLERCGALARTTLSWTREQLDEAARSFLAALPDRLDLGDVVVTHGAPGDPWHYVRTPEDAARRLAAVPEARVLVVGHTHHAMAVDEDGARAAPRELALGDERWLLNPGSVGQPRDSDPRGAWLELDTDEWKATYHRVAYDIDKAAEAIRDAGLPELLADRLYVGQ